MSAANEIDLESYSAAIAQLVEKAGAHVATIKAGAYRSASGLAFGKDLIAVNSHLLKREGKIPVQLPAGDAAEAEILGRDPAVDLAVLKVEGANFALPEAEEDAALRPGALAVVVGRTLDVGLSASVGILGAVGGPRRTWRGGELDRFLRLDVNLYPSQAGAIVVSARGKALGMATAALLRHSAIAVPMSTLNAVANELLTTGGLKQGYLGVGLQPVRIPEHLQSLTPLAGEAGLMIISIEPGSSAEKAGLQLGDILLAAGGISLVGIEVMMSALRGAKPTKFTVMRAGQVTTVETEIGVRASRRS